MKCCSCPHGAYATLPIIVLLGGFACSFIAVNSCRFVRLDLLDYDDYLELGLFGYMESPDAVYCTLYSTEDKVHFDSHFSTARIVAAVATGLGGSAMIMSWFLSCQSFRLWAIRIISVVLLLCSLLQGLTFLVLGSNVCAGIDGGYFEGSKDYTCNLNQGAVVNIAASAAWLVSSVVTWMIPPYTDFGRKDPPVGLNNTMSDSDGDSPKSKEGKADAEFPDVLPDARESAMDGESVVSFGPSVVSYGPSCVSYGVSVITDTDFGEDRDSEGNIDGKIDMDDNGSSVL